MIYAWGLCNVNVTWKYVETDSERGYVMDYREFATESEATDYARDILNKKYLAEKSKAKGYIE